MNNPLNNKVNKTNTYLSNDKSIDARWDTYVKQHPDGTVFHLTDYLACLQSESNEKLYKITCVDDSNDIVGIFPLLSTKGFPLGIGGLVGASRLSSLPRTPTGGPLALSPDIMVRLIEESLKIQNQNPNKTLQIKSFSNNLEMFSKDLYKVHWRDSYITSLPKDPNLEIKFGNSNNHSAIKRCINKAIKNGLTTRYSDNKNELKYWHSLYLDTMKHHMTPARSYSYFENLWNTLKPKDYLKLIIAEQNNKIIAGSILFYFNKTVIYAFNGSDRNFFEFRPNDLLHWNAIEDAIKLNYLYYDLGEVPKNNEGLAQYKKKWSANTVPIYHYYFPQPDKLQFESIDEGEVSGMKKLIWNLLPLSLTAQIGKWVYNRL
jgi:hypothetical protein